MKLEIYDKSQGRTKFFFLHLTHLMTQNSANDCLIYGRIRVTVVEIGAIFYCREVIWFQQF